MNEPRLADVTGGDLFVCDNCGMYDFHVIAVKYRLARDRQTVDMWWCPNCVRGRND